MKKIVKTHLDVARAHLDCIEMELSKPAMLPMTAKQFIASHAAPSTVNTVVPLFAIGDRDFSAIRHMHRQAGRQLGEEIAKKLDFAMSNEHQRDRHVGRANPFEVQYVSTVYAFTPEELTKLIDEALSVGR